LLPDALLPGALLPGALLPGTFLQLTNDFWSKSAYSGTFFQPVNDSALIFTPKNNL